MMSTELRPTPETDAAFWHGGVAVDADFARKLERERDSAKTLNRTLLDQLEAQAVQIEALRGTLQSIESDARDLRKSKKFSESVESLACSILLKLKPLLP